MNVPSVPAGPAAATVRQLRVASSTHAQRIHCVHSTPSQCSVVASAAVWGRPFTAHQAHQDRIPTATAAVSGDAPGASTAPEPPEGSGAPREEDGDDDLDGLFAQGRPTLRSIAGYIQAVLSRRVRAVRRWLFLKLLMLLMGFFFANALSTVVGQTGDWDILVAGFLVAMIESLGWFVHRVPRTRFWKRLPPQADDALAMVNYFKCGLIFGLFTDCFKVGS